MLSRFDMPRLVVSGESSDADIEHNGYHGGADIRSIALIILSTLAAYNIIVSSLPSHYLLDYYLRTCMFSRAD